MLFRSDPDTGDLPVDPLAGFLPPNDAEGRGEGFVSFRIRPVAGLPTATPIRNIAEIVFDENASIFTNQVDPHDPAQGTDPNKEALVTIDAEAPIASALTARKGGAGADIVLNMTLDDGAGSGLGSFDVRVGETADAMLPWQTVAATTATYAAAWGRTYYLGIRARDAVGHTEPQRSGPDATVIVPTWAIALAVTPVAGAPFGLWAGVDATATAGVDPGLDEVDPSAGGGGLAFASAGRGVPLAYDVQPDAPTVTWRLDAAAGALPMAVSWDRSRIPAGRYLWLVRLSDGRAGDPVAESFVDLGRADSVTLSDAGTYRLTLSTDRPVPFRLKRGWNLISLPCLPTAADPAALFGAGAQVRPPAWIWGDAAGYGPVTNLEPVVGAWVFAEIGRASCRERV